MPKENTHILFANRLLECDMEPQIIKLVSKRITKYYLGSLYPDIAYFSKKNSIGFISDRLHGNDGNLTNEIILELLRTSLSEDDIAFLYGLCTHFALDIAFHPVVYYFSGNYFDEDPQKRAHAQYRHYHLETCLDIYTGNRFRFYKFIKSTDIERLEVNRYIERNFSVTKDMMKNSFRRECFFNKFFFSSTIYSLFLILSKAGVVKQKSILGLFYPDARRNKCIFPDNIDYLDIITGESKTCTIDGLYNTASSLALEMIHAIHRYFSGQIGLSELAKIIPGTSLNTGKVGVSTKEIRYYQEY